MTRETQIVHKTVLKQVGNAVVLTIPTELLQILNIGSGTRVGLEAKNGAILIIPQQKPRYTLKELIAQCDIKARPAPKDSQWLNSASLGKEIL